MSSWGVSVSRIQKNIDSLAEFSSPQISGGGVTRLAFSKQETDAIDWARAKLTEFGYECHDDAFLNLHALDPRNGDMRCLVGTHLDSVKAGGKYDGTVGLVSFLEALHLREENKLDFSLPVDFVIFRAEESTMFKVALLGSKVATGYYDVSDLQNIGFKWEEELEDEKIRLSLGYSAFEGQESITLFDILSMYTDEFMGKIKENCWLFDYPLTNYRAYFEIHIEQGRVLETEGKDLGIVESIRAPHRMIYSVKGVTDHSGATPMGFEYRRDALCAASECVLAIEKICNEEHRKKVDIVGTVGELHLPFMGINKIPGRCSFTLDLRSSILEERVRVYRRIDRDISRICKKRDITLIKQPTEENPLKPISLRENKESTKIQEQMARAIAKLGYSCKRMPSGAGHDAMRMAQVGIPVCMLFIPCRNGISHSPEEYAKTRDILKASRSILKMLVEL